MKVIGSYKPTNSNPKYHQVVICSHPIAAFKICTYLKHISTIISNLKKKNILNDEIFKTF